MSTEVQPYASPPESIEDYRALSTAAVTSVLLGLLGGVAFLHYLLGLVPLLGLLAGVYAIYQINRRTDELTGRGLAWVGIGLSTFCFLGGLAVTIIDYVTELPPDTMRISYSQLQPDPKHPEEPIPIEAKKLEGQRVFIKGYVMPSSQSNGIKRFLLVPDAGTCCFGGNPKITDRIEVTLDEPLRLTYNQRLNKVAGVFSVKPSENTVDVQGGVYYHLKAFYLR